MLNRLRARLRRLPGVSQARFVAERAIAPHLRADVHDLRVEVGQLAGANHDLAARHHRTATTVEQIELHQPAVLNAIASTNGTTRLLRRELDDLRIWLDEKLAAMASDDAATAKLAAEAAAELMGDVAPAREALWELDLALRSHVETQAWLLGRVEAVRNEMLYELRYGRQSVPDPVGARSEPARPIVRMDEGSLRLNIGCGLLPLEGYVNIDMRDLPGVDVVAPVDELPVEPGSVAEIFSAHTIEHFPEEHLRRRLLPYWHDLLEPGGTFRAVTPDLGAMTEAYVQGEFSFEQLRLATFGGQEYEGDFHYTGFTVDSVSALLHESGFAEVEVVESGRMNGECLELEVRARRSVS